jgi:hypothetical protein
MTTLQWPECRSIQRLCFSASSSSDEKVDCDVGDGEQGAKRGGHTFQPLHYLLVLVHAAFQLRKPAWLSIAQDLLHLAL